MQIIVFKNSLVWGWKDNKCGFGFHHFFLKSKSCQWFFFGAGQEKGFFSSKHHALDPMLFWGLDYTDSRKKIRFIDSKFLFNYILWVAWTQSKWGSIYTAEIGKHSNLPSPAESMVKDIAAYHCPHPINSGTHLPWLGPCSHGDPISRMMLYA